MTKKVFLLPALLLLGLVMAGQAWSQTTAKPFQGGSEMTTESRKLATATFAGGCFWCVEADFDKIPGVVEAISGYTGGRKENPTYEEVCAGGTGHLEAVQVVYDPAQVTYGRLLEFFWRQVDPTDAGGQFVDRGSQYRTAIFYHNEAQKQQAEASKEALARSGRFQKPIVTEILPAARFYPAEKYHQNFCRLNPERYQNYRQHSGRDQFLTNVWGADRKTVPTAGGQGKFVKPSEAELRRRLSQVQYQVTQQDGTEPAFRNEYWDNKRAGLYVDIVTGEPLFSSGDKYDSGTGWPSFVRPLEPGNLVEREDRKLFLRRTEVRSKHGDSHLGHVFSDGPPPTGRRYCINSAALRFIPREDLEKEGYGRYLPLFGGEK